MDEWIDKNSEWVKDKWINEWMNEWMYGWMDEWMNKWMNAWMNGWIHTKHISSLYKLTICWIFWCHIIW